MSCVKNPSRKTRSSCARFTHRSYALTMATQLKVLLPYYLASCILLIAFGIFKVIHLLPFTDKAIEKLVKILATIEMDKEDYWKTLFGMKMFKTYQKIILRELQKEAQTGQKSPNPLLVSVDGSTTYKLLDWTCGDRPLVVNFGSCTCPVFMIRLCEFGEIVDRFSNVADFLTIYIEEAHPMDEWSLKNNHLDIPQHKSLDERCKAAQVLLDSGKLKTKLLVDSLSNDASRAFGAMPNRLYIIQGDKIQFAGGVGPTFYKPNKVAKWLENRALSDPNNNCNSLVDNV
ncbi:type I iodothyronine deiodinase [Exaiptasia diaphana]|uniref:Iodothyronine deiodinase n=1 Tax=Exaiptasia diaphana TaxID=2652724 RepID=A0A913Y6V9_EXADI|nr:type I iodothyronine deiodinase [Exaiptasia diaphana]XP_028519041.1 type I iodothyronine deiodinase [Exaiptasia diaphana]KXJ22422.1 Type I iodothyronine deiodinase [Exaiptasia diaphana]